MIPAPSTESANPGFYPCGQSVGFCQPDRLGKYVHIAEQRGFLLLEAIVIDFTAFCSMLCFILYPEYAVDHVFFTDTACPGAVFERKGLVQAAVHNVVKLVQNRNIAGQPIKVIVNVKENGT